jgi:hypothetical protein
VIGKSGENRCVNDFARTLVRHVYAPPNVPEAATVFSDGTEGVLGPRMTFVLPEDGPQKWRWPCGCNWEDRRAELGEMWRREHMD